MPIALPEPVVVVVVLANFEAQMVCDFLERLKRLFRYKHIERLKRLFDCIKMYINIHLGFS